MKLNSDPDEEELHSSPNPPAPRISWLVGGGALMLTGLFMLFSIVMTAVGIGMCIVGALMMFSAFLSETGWGFRTKTESETHTRKHSDGLLVKTSQRLRSHTESEELQNDRLHTKRV